MTFYLYKCNNGLVSFEDYKVKEEIIPQMIPTLKNELKLIPLMDEYFSNETGIKQSISAIKINSCKNNALHDYLSIQKQKIK